MPLQVRCRWENDAVESILGEQDFGLDHRNNPSSDIPDYECIAESLGL